MCNCGCEDKIMSEFGSITDFDVVYTGETITCGDDVIVEQGQTIRDSLDAIARVLCDKSDQADLDDLQVKVADVEDVANNAVEAASLADSKAQQALDEIDDIDMDVTPADVGVTLGNRVPLSLNGESWQPGGLLMSQGAAASTGVVRYTGGRIQVGDAVLPDDAVTKRQLDAEIADIDAVQADNTSGGGMVNSPQSLIMKSANSNINLTANSLNRRNIILNSNNSSMTGYAHNNIIIGCQDMTMANGFANSGVSAISSRIGNNRRNTSIIASSEAEVEDWASTTTLKWNSAVIASHGGVIQSSNSYTLVTGKRTQSNSSAQLVCGQSNIIEPSRSVEDPLKKNFIVGNGTGDVNNPSYPGERSNAFYVLQNGSAWLQNDLEIDKSGGGVVLKSPNGTRFLLTVGDDGSLGTTEI